ncbi:MAG: UbiA family prenyltransferase [Betaproteobacteria bacterium]|nr:UbiA family prenyltransferase [Betaproteobacteria bacterium]
MIEPRVRDLPPATPASVPLVVDLDGTIIRSDLLWESLACAISRKPWLAFAAPFWLLAGRPVLKEKLARAGPVDVEHLPYRVEVVDWLRTEHASGREIAIATGAHEMLAQRVARHLGIVGRVFATGDGVNLKGEAKRAALVTEYGERGFDYVGDSKADLPAFRSARVAHVAGSESLAASVRAQGNSGREFPSGARPLASILRLLRIPHWAKNVLVFVPAVTAHRVADIETLAAASLAFLAFSLVASAVYVMNDVADLDSDRRHPSKRSRPFAAGEVPIPWAAFLVALLLAGAGMLLVPLPEKFGLSLAAYFAMTILYSVWLKREAVLDVLTLTLLYTLRVFAGAAAIGVTLSPWLLGFSVFMFLSLALIKRHRELADLAVLGTGESVVAGRGYRAGDLLPVGMLGIASGYLSVLVFALFITGLDTLSQYRLPEVLWAAPFVLLYWISRAWLLAYRGDIGADPIDFAMRDPPSYAALFTMLAIVWIAT